MAKYKILITGALLSALFVSGCEEQAPKSIEYIRAIKTFTITEVASGHVRKFSAIVQATNSSALSFQVGGNVQKVNVKLGDRVKKGQILATLDRKPYQLDVQAAEADRAKARSNIQQKRSEYERQRKLYRKGWIAKARLDKHLHAFTSSRSELDYSISKLNLAKRDLRNTTLVAPFSGAISSKQVNPFVEVKPGQKLFSIDADGTLEVAFDVPETTISRVQVGMPVTIRFPTQDICVCEGRITEISSVAGRANAFPVKAVLSAPPKKVRSGMTTEVAIVLESEARSAGYMVPLAAIAPGKKEREGFVFIFDKASSTVKKTPVKAQGVQENMVALDGLKAGNIVAVAGVNFLVDGQKVKLLSP